MPSRAQSEAATPASARARGAWDWPTLALFAGCAIAWGGALMLASVWVLPAFVLLVASLVLHSSLTHEILHGGPCGSARAGTVLGLIQPGLAVPYLRFKRLHLAHHMDANLTDPYDDPEANYLDPQVWDRLPRWRKAVLRANNSLAGRMIIGPVLGQMAFMGGDLAQIRKGDRVVLLDWLLHLPGVALTLWVVAWSGLSIWVYLLVCYCALSVLKIRTFLEHRAHARCSARTAIVEDRGPLAFLFLNNNYHVVHHMHPQVAWYRLPALYRTQQARFLSRNQGYVYRSYGQIFRQYLWQAKDPVPHPLWQRPPE